LRRSNPVLRLRSLKNWIAKSALPSSFRDAPPNSGLSEFGIINVQVGYSRLGWAGPESITPVFKLSIHTPAPGLWIPGSRFARPGMTPTPKRKRTNFRWPQWWWRFTPLRTGPIPTTPGGWGLRNPGPKGPGQRSALLFASPHGVGLAEVGRYCDPANDPVTWLRRRRRTCRRANPQAASFDPLAEPRSRRNHAGSGVILKRVSRFSEKIMPWMTGGVAWM
jgi:hypothetical protein